jgi:hypothetical protein
MQIGEFLFKRVIFFVQQLFADDPDGNRFFDADISIKEKAIERLCSVHPSSTSMLTLLCPLRLLFFRRR